MENFEPKIICEICGGGHSTESHSPTETDKKEIQVDDSRENIEQELSPEILERIIARVEDINKDGIGFSSVFGKYKIFEKVAENILRNGLLGGPLWKPIDKSPEKWAQEVRQEKDAVIHFNITGRFHSHLHFTKSEREKMEKYPNRYSFLKEDPFYSGGPAAHMRIQDSSWAQHGGIIFLFDLKSFKETLPYPADNDEDFVHKLPLRSFTVADHAVRAAWLRGQEEYSEQLRGQPHPTYRVIKDDKERPLPDSGFGFIIKSRIAPRFFSGIVIDDNEPPKVSAKLTGAERENKIHEQLDMIKAERQSRTLEIVRAMKKTYKDKPELLLPVYDVDGNLLWPKNISYEQIKEFIVKRDQTDKKIT